MTVKSIKVKIKVSENFKGLPLPEYKTEDSAGVDLYAAIKEPITLLPGESKLIPSGIFLAIPKGFEGQVRPRSGLALKNQISIVNTPGTLDADYRGEIGIILINHGKNNFVVNRGDRIAQLVIKEYTKAEWQLVDDLDDTTRGAGGFGHTGNK